MRKPKTPTKSSSSKTADRLQALVTAKNGFELAELDLKLRGAGELTGTKQWGLSDLGMIAIQNIKMVEAARIEAREIISNDPTFKNHSMLLETLKKRNIENLHFE